MAIGAGKYDDVATLARLMTDARGVILVVVDGVDGSGFSAQLPPELATGVPAALRALADEIEATVDAANVRTIAANVNADRQKGSA